MPFTVGRTRANGHTMRRCKLSISATLSIDRGEIGNHHCRGAGILYLVAQFARDVEWVVVDHHGAGLKRRVVENDEIGCVRQTQAELVAGLESEALKSSRCTIDQGGEFAIRPTPPLE